MPSLESVVGWDQNDVIVSCVYCVDIFIRNKKTFCETDKPSKICEILLLAKNCWKTLVDQSGAPDFMLDK